MKTTHLPAIIFSLFIILVLALIFVNFNQAVVSAQGSNTTALVLQITTTPQAQDDTSVIGSTDGILAMGIVIVLIVTLPLLFRKKQK